MVEHLKDTGDEGRLKIIDRTNTKDRTVEFWVQSLSPIIIPNLAWTYSIDGVKKSWKSYNFKGTTVWQRLGIFYVPYGQEVTLHMGKTNSSELAGPTDFTIQLAKGISAVMVKVSGVYKRAIPYVKHAGVWKQASAHVNVGGTWKETV